MKLGANCVMLCKLNLFLNQHWFFRMCLPGYWSAQNSANMDSYLGRVIVAFACCCALQNVFPRDVCTFG